MSDGIRVRSPGLRRSRARSRSFRGDLRDAASLDAAFHRAWPDELYNLAGQSFVPASWDAPDEAVDLNVSGLLRLLRIVERRKPDTRVYQASSAEIFGRAAGPCSETTPLAPTSPYGVSKMAAHRLCEVYRQRGLFVVSGILFNHESPRRAPEMVTRKITLAAARWVHGDRTRLRLGSLDARRDWGYAGDYVKAMRAMLQAGVRRPTTSSAAGSPTASASSSRRSCWSFATRTASPRSAGSRTASRRTRPCCGPARSATSAPIRGALARSSAGSRRSSSPRSPA